VDRVLHSLRERRDSEYIRMQMAGSLDKPRKIRKRRKKVKAEGDAEDDPARARGTSVKGIFGSRKKTAGGAGKTKKSRKGARTQEDLVNQIATKLGE